MITNDEVREMVRGTLLGTAHSGYLDTAIGVYEVMFQVWNEYADRLLHPNKEEDAIALVEVVANAINECREELKVEAPNRPDSWYINPRLIKD